MDKDKIDKKEHILEVAERVFSELGFDGASTRMISGEAGVNMAMLNYYFGSKEGLFLAVFERRIAGFKNLLQNIGNDDTMSAWDKISKYLDMYAERVVNNNCFQKMLYQEMAVGRRGGLTEQISQILMGNVKELSKILTEGIDSGEFNKDVDVQMLIATVYGTKNFIINTPVMSSAMFGFDMQNQAEVEEKLKPRVKIYLKNILKAYLLNNDDHAKQ